MKSTSNEKSSELEKITVSKLKLRKTRSNTLWWIASWMGECESGSGEKMTLSKITRREPTKIKD